MSVFDEMAAAGSVPGVAMQIPDVLAELGDVLAQFEGDAGMAAQHQGLLRTWTNAVPETRAALLLSAAWQSRHGTFETVAADIGNVAAMYAVHLHAEARGVSEDSVCFHGAGFPAMPLPGRAGALASSLGFDRDDPEISLETALILWARATSASEESDS